MATAPFHRRILPWIFIVAFLAVAPIVLFYTSGYRWDAKKGKVERNSTVIIDSTPNSARIAIDGLDTKQVTPTTFETIDPGTHRISLSKTGFHAWEKSLDVRSDIVTFANAIHLWKDVSPQRITANTSTQLSLSPDGKSLLAFSELASSTELSIFSSALQLTSTSSIPMQPDRARDILWSDSARYALVYANDHIPWLIDVRAPQTSLALPPGLYHWEGTLLLGNDGKDILTIHLPQLGITRDPLPGEIVDQNETTEIRTATGTTNLVYVVTNQPTRGLVLPPGNWSLFTHVGEYALLRNANSWLALQDKSSTPEYHLAPGTMLRSIPPTSIFSLGTKPLQRYLVINGGELWAWDPHTDPQLLYRQSEPIIQAAWHHEGSDVFYATKTGIFALNTDPRDGYLITPLASFESINDMVVNGGTIIVAGTKEGQTGLWTLLVE